MTSRKYAIIMFTDIDGYMALLDSDREAASNVLHLNRKLHNRLIGKHHGKKIKEIEDGILASFDLPSDAIRCAVEIQRESKKADVSLRIGIHEGNMIFEGIDVLGDGVRVASRLQEISDRGCITISGRIYQQLKNKKGFSADFKGERLIENIKEPVKIYKVKCYEKGKKDIEIETNATPKKHILPYVVIMLLLVILILTFLWSLLKLPTQNSYHERPVENTYPIYILT